MKIKNFRDYLVTEDNEIDLGITDDKLSNEFTEIKDEINDMIEKSLNSSSYSVRDEFISAFIKDSENTKIEGLINESDIYEFYLKWRNDIDEILSDSKYYDEVPSENNVYGLYDFIINGTNKAILQIVGDMK